MSLGFPKKKNAPFGQSFLLCFGFCLFVFVLFGGEELIPQSLERESETRESRRPIHERQEGTGGH